MELCSVLCDSLGGRGVSGRNDKYFCMAESLQCSPKTITTLLIGYTPIQNKKCLKNFFKKYFTNLQIKNYCPHSPKKPDYFYKHIEGTKEHVRNQKIKFKKK